MIIKKITVDYIMTLNPCRQWPRSRVESLFGGRYWVKPETIAKDSRVDLRSRFYVLLREDIIPAIQLHELACDFAERALPMFESRYPNDGRPRNAIETKRRWIIGEATGEELTAARHAACDAIATVTTDSDADAAAAAAAAASDSAFYAANYASAASDSAKSESDKQIKMVIDVLRRIK